MDYRMCPVRTVAILYSEGRYNIELFGIRMNQRQGDACQRAILEWVDLGVVAATPAEEKPAKETKPEGAKETKAEASK